MGLGVEIAIETSEVGDVVLLEIDAEEGEGRILIGLLGIMLIDTLTTSFVLPLEDDVDDGVLEID